MTNVREKAGMVFPLMNRPMTSRVKGRINCKKPVKDNGIFPVANENIKSGVTDTTPVSQISGVVRGAISLGHIIG